MQLETSPNMKTARTIFVLCSTMAADKCKFSDVVTCKQDETCLVNHLSIKFEQKDLAAIPFHRRRRVFESVAQVKGSPSRRNTDRGESARDTTAELDCCGRGSRSRAKRENKKGKNVFSFFPPGVSNDAIWIQRTPSPQPESGREPASQPGPPPETDHPRQTADRWTDGLAGVHGAHVCERRSKNK